MTASTDQKIAAADRTLYTYFRSSAAYRVRIALNLKLERELQADEAMRLRWMRHWMQVGLEGLQAMLAGAGTAGRFCHGDQPTAAASKVFCRVAQPCSATDTNLKAADDNGKNRRIETSGRT